MSRAEEEGDDLIPLKEFARRLGRNPEATRRRFGSIAVERRGRLYFRPSDLERLIKAEQRPDDREYTVTRSYLARALNVDPRTVDKRLAHLPSRILKGQRRYRDRDVAVVLEAARQAELLSEVEVTLLMGGHHFWQLHLLIDFPQLLQDDAQRVPPPDNRGAMGMLWRRGRIADWAARLRENPKKVLKPKAMRIYRAAAAPLDPDNAFLLEVPVFRAHLDRLLARLERIRPHEEAFRKEKVARAQRL